MKTKKMLTALALAMSVAAPAFAANSDVDAKTEVDTAAQVVDITPVVTIEAEACTFHYNKIGWFLKIGDIRGEGFTVLEDYRYDDESVFDGLQCGHQLQRAGWRSTVGHRWVPCARSTGSSTSSMRLTCSAIQSSR